LHTQEKAAYTSYLPHPHLKNLLPEKAKRQEARKRKRLSMARRGKPGAGK
jgi:hypothetical protein